VASRSSEVNFTKNYTLLYLYLFISSLVKFCPAISENRPVMFYHIRAVPIPMVWNALNTVMNRNVYIYTTVNDLEWSLNLDTTVRTCCVWDSKPRPMLHCRVLPPDKFTDTIPEPLSVCF